MPLFGKHESKQTNTKHNAHFMTDLLPYLTTHHQGTIRSVVGEHNTLNCLKPIREIHDKIRAKCRELIHVFKKILKEFGTCYY